MNQALLKEFAQPGALYRGKPFWAWNGKLDPAELRRQIRLLHRMGLGGFFMHSRVGLNTAYLSPAWFQCIDACIDEAKQLGMEAWLYDEDRWPSGAAGGLVTRDPRYQMRALVMYEVKEPARFRRSKDTVAVFAAKVKGATMTTYRPLPKNRSAEKLAKGESLLEFKVVFTETSDWYNGTGYLDTMNHEAVAKFIEVTHEAYARNCGKEFGKTVPGIFSDEPNYGVVMQPRADGGSGIPWTAALPKVFKERHGYDLIPRLPEAFYDPPAGPAPLVRYHYLDTASFLFVDAYSRQIGEWCGKHGIAFTGHVLAEDSLYQQTMIAGTCMRFYEHMQIPGMDLLTEHWRIYDTAKQVSSAAHQFGRQWRLTETYGCTGWDFPFAGHKALGDWQVALGINLRCQHLAWYTMEGEAKRDYPAGIFYQSPWWELYPKVEDYFARINAVMTRGHEVRDLLVLHPVESLWVMARKDLHDNPAVKQYDRQFIELRDSLLTAHLDFDYGDEEIMARRGRVTSLFGQPRLTVGKAAYKAVLVPPLLTIRQSTLDLLDKFRKAGGLVVFAGAAPKLVDARPAKTATAFAAQGPTVPAQGEALVAALEKSCRRLSLEDAAGKQIGAALYLLREDNDASYLFVCNTGHEYWKNNEVYNSDRMVRDRDLEFPELCIRGFAPPCGAPLELDPDSGAVYLADAIRHDSGWAICTSLAKLGSRLFVIPKRGNPMPAGIPRRPRLETVSSRKLARKHWDIVLSEANNLVLDQPAYRLGRGKWQAATEILRIDRAVRKALGVPVRGGAMVQPWARPPAKTEKTIPLSLRYTITVKTVPSGDLFLALERPESFRITLNGQSVCTDTESGWWTDHSLRRLPLDPNLLHEGDNELLLTCDYRASHPGLEIVYLLGNFGVKLKDQTPIVTVPPTTLKIGDWTEQGLPFYSGNLSYADTVKVPRLAPDERLFVRVPEYRGSAVRVWVNGKAAGIIAWEPNEVDITSLLGEDKECELRIEVIGHRRNSHGPHHCAEKWPVWTGPGQYVGEGKNWCDGYNLVPCGLLKAPRIIIRRESKTGK